MLSALRPQRRKSEMPQPLSERADDSSQRNYRHGACWQTHWDQI